MSRSTPASVFDVAHEEPTTSTEILPASVDDERDPFLPPGAQILTFIPTPLAPNQSPLHQYRPFRTLPPEEQQSAAFLYDQLTPKQGRFVMAYLREWDEKKASKETGVPVSILKNQAVKTLVTLLKRADQAYFCRKTAITRERYLEELQHIGFFDPAELFDMEGNFKKVKDLPHHVRTALKVTNRMTPKGPDITIQPYEKTHALHDWGQTMGYLEETPLPRVEKAIEVILVPAKPQPAEVSQERITNEPDDRHPPRRIPSETITPF